MWGLPCLTVGPSLVVRPLHDHAFLTHPSGAPNPLVGPHSAPKPNLVAAFAPTRGYIVFLPFALVHPPTQDAQEALVLCV